MSVTHQRSSDSDSRPQPQPQQQAQPSITFDTHGILGDLPGYRLWRDRLDESLARHGVRLTGAPESGDERAGVGVGNIAGCYPQPPHTHSQQQQQQQSQERESMQAQMRPRRVPRCYACLVMPIETERFHTLEHPLFAYLCRDCRELARAVCQNEADRQQMRVRPVLDAFFRYIWRIIPNPDQHPDEAANEAADEAVSVGVSSPRESQAKRLTGR